MFLRSISFALSVIFNLSDCFGLNIIISVSEDKKCECVKDILTCKSVPFKCNNNKIELKNIYRDVIIDSVAMINFLENKENNEDYSLEGLSYELGRSLKALIDNPNTNAELKEKLNSDFFARQLMVRVCITGGGTSNFLNKLRTSFNQFFHIIEYVYKIAVQTS